MLTVHRVALALCAGPLAAAAMPTRRADPSSSLSCTKLHSAMTLGLLGYGSDESHLTGVASDLTITDRYGDEAPVLVSDDDMAAQKFDFWVCDSSYFRNSSISGNLGQFRPTQEDGSMSDSCLTAATSDLTLYNQDVTLSKNCDSEDNVLFNFWDIVGFRGTNTANLIGPKVNNADYLPGGWALEKNGQSGDHTLVQLIHSTDDDRRKRDGMPFWLTLS